MISWRHRFFQNTNRIFVRISALASSLKWGQIKKYRHFIPLIRGFYFDSLTLLFWFDLFLEARAEILTKFLLVFWEKRCLNKIISIFNFTDLYSHQLFRQREHIKLLVTSPKSKLWCQITVRKLFHVKKKVCWQSFGTIVWRYKQSLSTTSNMDHQLLRQKLVKKSQ